MTRVLIVENERIVAMDLRSALEANGFVVVGTISRGGEVLSAARAGRPDIVLMDVNLDDEVDGIEAARLVRAELDLPVVFLTALNDPPTSRRIQDSGAQGYLIKPFEEEEVARILMAALAQHAAQRSMRQQREELSLLVEAMSDAVITVDENARITHVNPGAERLLKLRRALVDGRELDQVFELRDGRDGPVIALDLAGDQTLPIAWLSTSRTPPIPVSCSVHALRLVSAGTRLVVIVLQDLSTRRRVQESLVSADRMVTVRMMAGNIAHGINNPLQYVLANLESVAKRLAEGESISDADTELLDLLGDALKGGRAIETMVRDLKVISSGDHRTSDVIDVREVVAQTVRQMQQQQPWRGHHDLRLGTTPPVAADPKALQQVVINLLQNAVLALPEGRPAVGWVRVETGRRNEEVFIEVEDNGVGIPNDVVDHMFEPFFTTRSVGQGSGLGLAVVQQIVSDLEGHIDVWSEVGRGTRVRVSLPCSVGASIPAEASIPPASRDLGASLRVLVVDDDALVRRALVSMLSRVHQVESASGVDEALERLAADAYFDAILCDLMMSPRNGVELVESLAAEGSPMVDRVAFITGGVVSGELQERVVATQRPVAYKPIDRNKLLDLVTALAG